MADMTYAQGYNKVSRLFFSNMDIQRRFMSTLVGREFLLLLLHMYRFHMFDGRLSLFSSDEELLREAQGLCMDPSRETTRVYCRVSKSLQWPHLSLKGTSLVSFLNELATISDEWYEEHFAHLFDDLLLSPDPYGQYVDLPEPQEIQDLIFSLVDIKQVHSVYNPFAGLSSFGVNLPSSCYYCGQEQISNVYALSLLRLMAHNVTNYEFYNEDSFSHWRSRTYPDDKEIRNFDLIVSFPPLGVRREASEADMEYEWDATRISYEDFFISNGVCGVPYGGTVVGVFSQGTLFASGATAKQRKDLIRKGWIDTVVDLPAGLLSNTGIPLCVVVYSRSNKNDGRIRFVNATSFCEKSGRKNILLVDKLIEAISNEEKEVVRYATLEEVESNNYNLAPSRYFLSAQDKVSVPEGFEMVGLKDLVKIDRGWNKELDSCKTVKGRDLSSSATIEPIEIDRIQTCEVRSGRCKVLTTDSILVLKIGQLKPTLFRYSPEVDVTCNSNVVALSFDTSIYPQYLISELRKDYVTEQFAAMARGSVMQSISQNDLLEIKVLMPVDRDFQKTSFENEQRLIREQSLKALQVEEYLKKERDRIFELMSIRRHRINPYFSGLTSNIQMIMDEYENSKTLSLDSEIGPDYTLGDALNNMLTNLSDLKILFKELTSEVEVGTPESFSLSEFLVDYSFTHTMPDRQFSIKKDLKKSGSSNLPVHFNKGNLKEILDEIIHNAEKHFPSGTADGVVVLTAQKEEKDVCLYITNNGAPVPEDFDEERSFTAGYHKDENGTGMGLFRVRQVCEEFGASIAWANDVKSATPVGLCVTFKIGEE